MKRFFDFLISLILFVVLLPVFVLVGILVRYKLGAPVLFKQMRPGLHGKPFIMYKFRSMTDKRDEKETLLPDVDRFTRFSSFLRKSSLDELPELINVLKGDMSLVGPRPLLMQYLERYNTQQAKRHNVKPGITGWAQVNGRNSISWEEKFKKDVWYVENQTLGLDMKILISTIAQVCKREGINQKGHVTAEEFMGDLGHGQ
ncbi:MAG: sugar transferase [Desulfobacula sp.]|jgi:sugar transferase EpsL|nr:sugar transferase [Desulfobacula sp.]